MTKGKKVGGKRRAESRPEFYHSGLKTFMSEATVLLALFGEQTCALGCGVIIGHRMALTARHVMEALFEAQTGTRPKRFEGKTKINLRAIHFVEKGARIQVWNIRKAYFGPTLIGSDLALLLLEPMTEDQLAYRWRRPSIQLLPPRIGSRIWAFGYHSMEVVTTMEGRERININPYTTTGTVKGIHHAGRDTVQLRFPCFRTNARFDPGMSGAPVFSEGRLCGIICANMPPETAYGEHTSYVSVLWPMMGIHVEYARTGENPELQPLVALARDKLIRPTDLAKAKTSLVMMFITQKIAEHMMAQGQPVRISIPAPPRERYLPKRIRERPAQQKKGYLVWYPGLSRARRGTH